jgi:hypothetical protein
MIGGTSLDKQSEITALAAMDEHERQGIVDRAVAGEKVSAAKAQRKANIGGRLKRSNNAGPGAVDPVPGDNSVNSVPFSMHASTVPRS